MGHSNRYPGHRIDSSIEAVAVRPKPIGLTDEELDLEHHLVRKAAQPIPVKVWVRFPETVIRPNALAVAWSERAVQVRWTGHAGQEFTA